MTRAWVLIVAGLLAASNARARGLERLGDFLVDRANKRVTPVYNKSGSNYGFSSVKAWFNRGQNGHPAYYLSRIAPGVVADRHGELHRLHGSTARLPRVGTIVTVPAGTYSDSQVRIPSVRLKKQSFEVMRLGRRGRILIPIRPARGRR